MTQVMQGMCIKTEAEHYRRIRNELDSNGKGHTMGSIYWQLNDIWQAPSWASIEYGGRWKVLQYLAKDFYAPVIASSYILKGVMAIYVVNDLQTSTAGNITLHAWSYTTGLKMSWSFPFSIKALTAQNVHQRELSQLLAQSGCTATTCIFTINLEDHIRRISHENFLFIGDPKSSVFSNPNFQIVEPKVVRDGVFSVGIKGTNVAPLVWLETDLPGRFERNGFVYTQGVTHVRFFAWEDMSLQDFLESLSVQSLYDRS